MPCICRKTTSGVAVWLPQLKSHDRSTLRATRGSAKPLWPCLFVPESWVALLIAFPRGAGILVEFPLPARTSSLVAINCFYRSLKEVDVKLRVGNTASCDITAACFQSSKMTCRSAFVQLTATSRQCWSPLLQPVLRRARPPFWRFRVSYWPTRGLKYATEFDVPYDEPAIPVQKSEQTCMSE